MIKFIKKTILNRKLKEVNNEISAFYKTYDNCTQKELEDSDFEFSYKFSSLMDRKDTITKQLALL